MTRMMMMTMTSSSSQFINFNKLQSCVLSLVRNFTIAKHERGENTAQYGAAAMSNPNKETHNINIAQTDDVDKFCNFTLVFPTLSALFTPRKILAAALRWNFSNFRFSPRLSSLSCSSQMTTTTIPAMIKVRLAYVAG